MAKWKSRTSADTDSNAEADSDTDSDTDSDVDTAVRAGNGRHVLLEMVVMGVRIKLLEYM